MKDKNKITVKMQVFNICKTDEKLCFNTNTIDFLH
jgi:hypothetical protein